MATTAVTRPFRSQLFRSQLFRSRPFRSQLFRSRPFARTVAAPTGSVAPDRAARPARGRWTRMTVAGAAVVALIGPLVYTFTTAGEQRPRTAGGPPAVGIAQPWPERSSPGATPSSSAAASAPVSAPSSGGAPASGGPGAPASWATGDTASRTDGSGARAAPVQPEAAPGAASTSRAQTTTAPAAVAKATATRLSGVGCANNSNQNWYTNAWDSRWSQKSGGASGCGQMVAMPMSGDASYDTSQYVVWWFVTKPVVTGSCAVSVFIPSTGVANDVAGRPAYYKVLGGRNSSTIRGRFSIDQTANRGRWVNAGSYPVSNGEISVHLANRGSSPNGERIGAAQVRLNCTAT